jgi:nitrogen fixation protein NifT
MPNVIIRRNQQGQLSFYVPKKDLEEAVTSIEHDSPTAWGGEVQLADGSKFFIEPMDKPPQLPLTIRVKRL